MPAANAAQCAVLQPLGIDDRTLVTPREAEVLLWVAQGKANAGIATTLGCAENTVKVHLARIFEKLGFENRNAAAVRALEVMSSPTAKPRDTGNRFSDGVFRYAYFQIEQSQVRRGRHQLEPWFHCGTVAFS